MSGFTSDYIGFTYNGTHSSDLGIVRVSDGSRFNENLLPTIQDKTVQVPGGDGTYYFGSYYTQRQFAVSYAFDSLDEEGIARLKRHFGDKQVHDLIFDETPYKVYSAKVTGTATLKYIPFAEGETNRLYKGEGQIQFTCFYPFARCLTIDPEEYLDLSIYEELDNEEKIMRVEEWWTASRIPGAPSANSQIKNDDNIANFGDVAIPFMANIKGLSNIVDNKASGQLEIGGQIISWEKLPDEEEEEIILNTKTGLAIGNKGKIYNKYFKGNMTMKMPVGLTWEGIKINENSLESDLRDALTFSCEYY